MLVYATLKYDKTQLETWWSVSTSGAMIKVSVSDAEPQVQAAFSALAGKNLKQLQSTTKDVTLAQQCALALLSILEANGMFE